MVSKKRVVRRSKKAVGAADRAKMRRLGPPVTVAQLVKKSEVIKGNKYMPVAEAKKMRAFLLALRERMTGQINFLAADNISRSEKDNEVSFRSEEQGTDNFERDFALHRVSQDQDILFEIDEALNRLSLGTYGICDGCGRGIEKARLKALPYSRMCVACQSRSESGQKKFKSIDAAASIYTAEKSASDSSSDEE